MLRSRLDPRQVELLDEATVQFLRQKTPAERTAMIAAAHRVARSMIGASVRRRHPDWNAEAVAREVSQRLLNGST